MLPPNPRTNDERGEAVPPLPPWRRDGTAAGRLSDRPRVNRCRRSGAASRRRLRRADPSHRTRHRPVTDRPQRSGGGPRTRQKSSYRTLWDAVSVLERHAVPVSLPARAGGGCTTRESTETALSVTALPVGPVVALMTMNGSMQVHDIRLAARQAAAQGNDFKRSLFAHVRSRSRHDSLIRRPCDDSEPACTL